MACMMGRWRRAAAAWAACSVVGDEGGDVGDFCGSALVARAGAWLSDSVLAVLDRLRRWPRVVGVQRAGCGGGSLEFTAFAAAMEEA